MKYTYFIQLKEYRTRFSCSVFHWMLIILFIQYCGCEVLNAGQEQVSPDNPVIFPFATVMNINELTMWTLADGRLFPHPKIYSPHSSSTGVTYPNSSGRIVSHDGILWGGLVHDGKYFSSRYGGVNYTRVGGSDYKSGLRPGRILSKGISEQISDTDNQIWRIRRDWNTADLKHDATSYFQNQGIIVTESEVTAIRDKYECDWREWPWEKGAPFYDNNGNGRMDDDEEPGIAYADQVIWYITNDLDSTKSLDFWGSLPIGLEVQVALWAYNRAGQGAGFLADLNDALSHMIFKRIRLIYKGCEHSPDSARIDSMYLAQWADISIGFHYNDLAGCDTLLNIGYIYNGYENDPDYSQYGVTPAAGYMLLYGPFVPSVGETAFKNFRFVSDYSNLPMTAFGWHTRHLSWDPCGYTGDKSYNNSIAWYNCFKGWARYVGGPPLLYPFPPGMKPGPFPLSGDPVKHRGFIDGLGVYYSFGPGDRQITCSSGPFSMALGDTQEVVIALVAGQDSSHLLSVSEMKRHAKWARLLADSNFEIGFADDILPESVAENIPSDFYLSPNYPNPFNAETSIGFHLPFDMNVQLKIYDARGRLVRVLHEGAISAGMHTVQWDGNDDVGQSVSSGLYICRLEADRWGVSRKMVLLQ